jgi:hypothetical protein
MSPCIILDNLKAGVNHACYYDPGINKTFAAVTDDLCYHIEEHKMAEFSL